MSDNELCWMPALELAAKIKQREVSPVDATEAVLAQIERLNPQLNAYVTLTADAARESARAAEEALGDSDAELGALHGVPISVKDMIWTKGVRTTFGSKLREDFVPPEDAPAVERAKAAGAILIGKTNTPDHGWRGGTHNPLFGATRSPWNPELTPGGSSGGASASLAAGMAPLAIGSDAGGSVRIPAAFAGVVGFKPTFGRVSTHPQSPAWSLAHVGPMSRTVADAALLLGVISGPDDRDPHCLPADDVDYLAALEGDLSGLRVAWSGTFGYATVDDEVLDPCEKAAMRFEEFGCTVEATDLDWPDPRPAWRATWMGGAATRFASVIEEQPDALDPELVEALGGIKDWGPTTYADAWFERLAFVDHASKFFDRYDLLLSPTTACAAFEVETNAPVELGGESGSHLNWNSFGPPFNMTGQPAISVPCGFTEDGRPIGLQIAGHRFEEATVLRAAARFEEAQPWADRRPPIS